MAPRGWGRLSSCRARPPGSAPAARGETLDLVPDQATLDRETLIAEIATTLHETSAPQRTGDQSGEPAADRPSDDDRERAAEVVADLERLGLYPRERRPSGFGFFRHPLVVGAGIAVISALFASLLLPSFTRVSADRPKELELKRDIVSTLETSSAQALARGLALARSDVTAAGASADDKRITAYRKLYGAWLADAGAINAELFTYFPGSYEGGWRPFEDAIRKYLRLAGVVDPAVRGAAATRLRSYLNPRTSSTAQYRTIYASVPWDKLATGNTDPSPTSSRSSTCCS